MKILVTKFSEATCLLIQYKIGFCAQKIRSHKHPNIRFTDATLLKHPKAHTFCLSSSLRSFRPHYLAWIFSQYAKSHISIYQRARPPSDYGVAHVSLLLFSFDRLMHSPIEHGAIRCQPHSKCPKLAQGCTWLRIGFFPSGTLTCKFRILRSGERALAQEPG